MSTETNTNIGTQALLASLSFGLPRQSRQLKKEVRKLEEDTNAQPGVIKGTLCYFQQMNGKITNDALADLKSHFGFWKKEHDRLTLPWMGSTRLLAAAIAPHYFDMRSKMEEIAPVKLQEFLEVYDDWYITAPSRMGALYSQADYPTKEECRERISWETTLMPLPESAQWQRIALINPQHAAAEAARMDEAMARARAEARLDTWRSLIGHFEHITQVLSKDKAKIYDTLLGNLTQMLDLIPAYGPLFEDEALTRCAAETKATLATVNSDDLRNDPQVRATTLRNAQELLARFGSMGARKFA